MSRSGPEPLRSRQHYGTERATAFVIELEDDYGRTLKEPVKRHKPPQAKMHNAEEPRRVPHSRSREAS